MSGIEHITCYFERYIVCVLKRAPGDAVTVPGSATYCVTLGRLFNFSEFGVSIIKYNNTHLGELNKITCIKHVAQSEIHRRGSTSNAWWKHWTTKHVARNHILLIRVTNILFCRPPWTFRPICSAMSS